MPYSYIDHASDVAIRAESHTLEGAFEAGAEAMLAVMFDMNTIEEKSEANITVHGDDIELLFVETLNEILSVQGRLDMAAKRFTVGHISKNKNEFKLTGTVFGEQLNIEKHDVRTEVKGATYSGLRYLRPKENTHVLECVIDV